jgi:DNA-binding transcriptional LysR family regulator
LVPSTLPSLFSVEQRVLNRLEAMTILLAAVDSGSLSAASRQLRVPLATVSRRMLQLEKHLNVRLLMRGNRKLRLTDAGRGYVASCRRIIEDIAEAERTAAGEYRAPQGELIMSVPATMGRTHALPIIVEFLRTFPNVRVRMQLTDRLVNLLEENFDLAMRVSELPDSSLIATRVGLIRRVVCASPAYLKRRGAPKKPADLTSHDCVAFEGYEGSTVGKWEFVRPSRQTIEVSSPLVLNNGEAAVSAAVAGIGITQAYSHQVDELVKSRALVTLLEEFEPAPIPVSLIYPSQRQIPLKLRAFLDFAVPRLRSMLRYRDA